MMMKRLLVILGVMCISVMVAAQDPSHYKVLFEDNQVRVLRVTLEKNEHGNRHPPGTVVIYLTSNKGTFTLPYSSFGTREIVAGDTYKLEKWDDETKNGSPQIFRALIVEIKRPAEVKPDAKPGDTETVCSDRAVPDGWVLMDIDTSFTRCNGDWDDLKAIKNTLGLPVGTELSVCKDSPVPEDWVEVGTTTDFTRCGSHQPFDNLRKIKRVQHVPHSP